MDLYDIDFSKFAVSMLPPDKRFTKTVAFIRALLSPIQWVRDLWLGEYRTGTTAFAWSNVATYQKYNRVLYNKIVYESLINTNTSNPTITTSWMVVQSNFIGLSERILFTGQTLTLTYALNKWFGTVFRQPTGVSDIYISTNTVAAPIFRVGTTEAVSSSVSTVSSSEFVGISDAISAQINFTIFVPTAVYNALDSGMVNNNKIFRNFADKYIPAGLIYQITVY